MPSKYFQILDDFKLSNPKTVNEVIQQLDSVTIENLNQEISKYYENNISNILTDIKLSDGFNLYCSQQPVPSTPNLQLLRASCLYLDKLIMWDGLQGFFFNLKDQIPIELSKESLTYHINRLLAIRDLAEYGLLILVPYSLYSQETWQQFEQMAVIDANNMDFQEECFPNIEIWSDDILTIDEHKCGMRKVFLGHNTPRYFSVLYTSVPSQCSVDIKPSPPFRLHTPKGSYEFNLKKVSLEVINSDEHIKSMVDNLVNGAARNINIDLISSEYLNASYFTDFDVHWQLVHWKLGQQIEKHKKKDITRSSVPIQLLMDLKFLDEIPLSKILEIRDKEEGAFGEFRQALRKSCKNIEYFSPPDKLEEAIKTIKEDEITPELKKVDNEFRRLKKHKVLEGITATISIGSIIAIAVTVDPLALLGAPSAAASIYKHKLETDAAKNNSMYFLWRLKQ